jgi:hypothetical protein
MEPSKFIVKNTQAKSFDLNNTSSKMDLSFVFKERYYTGLTEISEYKLFMAHFNRIPNCIMEENIDCKKANNWLLEKYGEDIKDLYYNKRCLNGGKNAEYDDIFYFLYDDLIVNFDINCSLIRFLYKTTDFSKVNVIIESMKKIKIRKVKHKPEISLVFNSEKGLDTKDMGIIKPKFKIEDNYNDDFVEIHKTIIKRFSRKNDKGLVLLHGKPGTGKTSYIRYLIAHIKKRVIFLPPNLASAITNPNLITILMDNPNSVFVIEDAENIVVDREKDGNSPVSALLNISDGLLSDCLNIQIICSFNTDISKIDNALMRKGRLIAKYEFKELETDKAQRLANKLGHNAIIDSPMTLTDIYNLNDNDFQQSRKANPIGFKTVNAN